MNHSSSANVTAQIDNGSVLKPSAQFWEQVELRPNDEAVCDSAGGWTYEQLGARVEYLENRLREAGLVEGAYVAIVSERNADLAVVMLAAIGLGAAFYLIDPKFPSQRISAQLGDLKPQIILALNSSNSDYEGYKNFLNVDLSLAETLQPKAERRQYYVQLDCPAYVFFTSGSTGTPKAAEVACAGFENHLRAKITDLELTSSDTFAQLAAPSFDIVVWQFLAPLMVGARVVVVPDDVLNNAELMLDIIEQQSVTAFELVPSMLVMILDEVETQSRSRDLSALRLVFSNAERLTANMCERWFTKFPNVALFNSWGATECSDDVTHIKLTSYISEEHPSVGWPIANSTVYVLDETLSQVPNGVVGELYIGGIPVGLGYKNDTAKTVKAFLNDPFSSDPDAKLYRTGDLGLIRSNGSIEFVGRSDSQVKVRGYRVELGEIEAQVQSLPGIAECVVVAPSAASTMLIAYVLLSHVGGDASCSKTAQKEFVDEWQALWQDNYREAPSVEDETFNATGWNSSFTGKPLPAHDVEQWVNHTVSRILDLSKGDVLEIGCGSGLLMHRIASHVQSYVGLDYSENVISQLKDAVDRQGYNNVSVGVAEANDLSSVDGQQFDLVVINSVIQYFPSTNYLTDVIEGASRALKPNGVIFIGDVRDERLLYQFHAAIEECNSKEGQQNSDQLIEERLSRDKELVVHPDYFKKICGELSTKLSVSLLVKRGKADVEMNTYRYDVVFFCSDNDTQPAISWTSAEEIGNVFNLVQSLSKPAKLLGISGVKNERVHPVQPEVLDAVDLVDPDALCKSLDDRNNLNVPLVDANEHEFKIVVGPSSLSKREIILASRDDAHWDSKLVSNQPIKKLASQIQITEIKSKLEKRLPDHMMPTAIHLVDALPRTATGKVDKRALTARAEKSMLAQKGEMPQNGLEELIVSLWSERLGLEHLTREVNFFEIGGNSLLAANTVAELRRTLNVQVPIRLHFEKPTVATLAEALVAQFSDVRSWLEKQTPIDKNASH